MRVCVCFTLCARAFPLDRIFLRLYGKCAGACAHTCMRVLSLSARAWASLVCEWARECVVPAPCDMCVDLRVGSLSPPRPPRYCSPSLRQLPTLCCAGVLVIGVVARKSRRYVCTRARDCTHSVPAAVCASTARVCETCVCGCSRSFALEFLRCSRSFPCVRGPSHARTHSPTHALPISPPLAAHRVSLLTRFALLFPLPPAGCSERSVFDPLARTVSIVVAPFEAKSLPPRLSPQPHHPPYRLPSSRRLSIASTLVCVFCVCARLSLPFPLPLPPLDRGCSVCAVSLFLLLSSLTLFTYVLARSWCFSFSPLPFPSTWCDAQGTRARILVLVC